MVEVVYEDDWLMVLDKPAGLLTIPTPKQETRTLVNILNDRLKTQGASYRLHPCHRLDRETSGLIIFAKGKSPQKEMMETFRRREVKKTYLAFVQGSPKLEASEIKDRIGGQSAVTEYKVKEKRSNFTVVEVRPLTGRTNQIRIHFKSIGHSVVGEDKYAFRKDFALKSNRLCLHAAEIEFKHPVTKERLRLVSPMPVYLKEFLIKHA